MRGWFNNLSLRTKASLIVLTVITLALSVMAVASTVYMQQWITKKQAQNVTAIAQNMARSCELALAVQDLTELERLAHGYLWDPYVLFIGIYDKNHELLAHAQQDEIAWRFYLEGRTKSRGYIVGRQPVRLSSTQGSFDKIDELTSGFEVTNLPPDSSNVFQEDRLIGEVVVGLSMKPVYAAQRDLVYVVLATLLITIAFSVLVMEFSVRFLVRRLQTLVTASEQISRGEYQQQIHDTNQDELGRLSRSFIRMSEALQQRDADLRKLNSSLQDQVEQRTQELVNTNRELETEILERKKAEAEVRKLNEELENRVVERTVELEDTHKKLVDASRQAGMAEVATGVLHNVGNVLNSVNVSAQLISEKLSNSEIGNLEKVIEIINENIDDLNVFISQDPKGKYIPLYLSEVTKLLTAEQGKITEIVKSLTKNIDHIKEIVKMQQSYAKVSGVEVNTTLTELVEDALEINIAGLARHGIEIIREYEELPQVSIDKQRVLQILVNLIGNAKYALSNNNSMDKRLTLRVRKQDENNVRIEICDNGIGISQENLTKIFHHGFTTKRQGHGFGLHSGAIAAQELKGSLTVHSQGVDQGATFTLILPFKSAEITSA